MASLTLPVYPVWITINKLNLVLNWKVPGHVFFVLFFFQMTVQRPGQNLKEDRACSLKDKLLHPWRVWRLSSHQVVTRPWQTLRSKQMNRENIGEFYVLKLIWPLYLARVQIVHSFYLFKATPRECTHQWLSFEWLHFWILSTDSKVGTTLHSIINSTTGKYCSVAFIWIRSHFRISSTDSKVRTTLYIIENITTSTAQKLSFK